jgi:hypothetical protein
MHRLFAPRPGAPDVRARAATEPQRAMMERLSWADPTFSTQWWHSAGETHRRLCAAELVQAVLR